MDADVYQDAALRIDWRGQRVDLRGSELVLTWMEWRILRVLVRNRQRWCDAEMIAFQVLGHDGIPASVKWHINRIRTKLGADRSLIDGRRGFGYRYQEATE